MAYADGFTTDPIMVSIIMARQVNAFMGGLYVTPETVLAMPPELYERIKALMQGLPQMQDHKQKIDNVFAEFRKEAGYRQ